MNWNLGRTSKVIQLPLILIVALTLMGCASGIQKTEGWKIEDTIVQEVRDNCKASFPEATSGTIAGLWENKRAILKQSRSCSSAASILADQVENRNKVLESE